MEVISVEDFPWYRRKIQKSKIFVNSSILRQKFAMHSTMERNDILTPMVRIMHTVLLIRSAAIEHTYSKS